MSNSLFSTQTPAQQAAAAILQIANNSFYQLNQSGTTGYNLLWNNKNATVQDICTALGTNGKKVFQLAALNQTTVASAATICGTTPPTIPSVPTGYTVTFDTNGNATVTHA